MKNSLERKYYPNSDIYIYIYIYIYFVTVGVRTSLRVPRLILRNPEVNDQVTLRIYICDTRTSDL
jgi:hypothetical protein